MSLYEICERCDNREHQWNVHEYELRIGELHRKPHLCDLCAVTVMSHVMAALKPVRQPSVAGDAPQEPAQ